MKLKLNLGFHTVMNNTLPAILQQPLYFSLHQAFDIIQNSRFSNKAKLSESIKLIKAALAMNKFDSAAIIDEDKKTDRILFDLKLISQ